MEKTCNSHEKNVGTTVQYESVAPSKIICMRETQFFFWKKLQSRLPTISVGCFAERGALTLKIRDTVVGFSDSLLCKFAGFYVELRLFYAFH